MNNFDIAIIGTGPAGLEASITSKIRNKKIILIGKASLSDKIERSKSIKNYLGFSDISGKDLCTNFKNHLSSHDISITDDYISMVYDMGDVFSLQGKKEMYNAKAIILATGINYAKKISGEEKFLGNGVSYCATCDALLYKNKTCIVVGSSKQAETEAKFLSEICNKVLYVPLYNDATLLSDNIEIINDIPLEITGDNSAEQLILKQHTLKADGIFIIREDSFVGDLIPGLLMNKNYVNVDRQMRTNLQGVFACGDVVGPPFQYIKAAGEGNVAALSAIEFLDSQKKGK